MIPVPHSAELPPKPPENPIFSNDNSDYDDDHRQQDGKIVYCDPTFEANCFSPEPRLLTQDLNVLVRDLNLSKKQAEPLGSRLNAWDLLHQDNEIYLFLNC
jgi:hypothetical protein